MGKGFAVLLAAALAGCATSREIYTPDGRRGHSINCDGTVLSWGNCYEKAGELCGTKGYVVLAGGAERGAVVTSGFGGTTVSRNMLVQCKD